LNFKIAKRLLFLIIILISNSSFAQILSDVRVGLGIGETIYIGSQMDYKFYTNTYRKNEFNLGYNFQIYKALNDKSEIGFRYLTTQFWSFIADNTLGINAQIKEFSVIYQKSLNENIRLNSSQSKFTSNFIFGLGIISFKSRAYIIDKPTQIFKVLSSVGNGDEYVSSGLIRPEDQFSIAGIVGYNLGYRLNKNFSIYFENSLSVSSSNYIHGNLLSRAKFPNSGYTHHALTLYYNLFSSKNEIGCPKF
jgi:hypothetical protein